MTKDDAERLRCMSVDIQLDGMGHRDMAREIVYAWGLWWGRGEMEGKEVGRGEMGWGGIGWDWMG